MGPTFEKIMKIGSKKSFRRWWVKMQKSRSILQHGQGNFELTVVIDFPCQNEKVFETILATSPSVFREKERS